MCVFSVPPINLNWANLILNTKLQRVESTGLWRCVSVCVHVCASLVFMRGRDGKRVKEGERGREWEREDTG